MGSPISFNRPVMAIKKQTVRGTGLAASAFSDADCDIEFENITVSPDVEFIEKKYAMGNHDRSAAMVGRRKCTVTASVDLRYSGAVDTPPKAFKAFQACGLVQTINAASNVTLHPNKSNDLGPDGLPYTILVYDEVIAENPDAFAIRITNALGNVKIVGDDQRTLRADFEFTGILETPEDIANANLLTLTGNDTGVIETTIGTTVSAAAIAKRVDMFELDAGNVIEFEVDLSTASGYLSTMIVDRKPTFKFNPLVDLVATDAPFTSFLNMTESVLSLATLHYAISAQKAQLQMPGMGSNGEAKAWDLTYNLNKDVSSGRPWILTHS